MTTPVPPDSLPKYLADGLPKQNTETLEDIQGYVAELIEYQQQQQRRPIPEDELPVGAEPVETTDPAGAGAGAGTGTIVKERVKCGADCTCNDGTGHGPYLYRYFRNNGTLTSEYIGKP